MEPLVRLEGPAAPMVQPDINTDLIAPIYTPGSTGNRHRSFGIGREEMARMLFANLRYDKEDRERPDFILNREPFRRARFLIAGPNFGCGSSRDTAPAMLAAFGIRCVVAPSYGGIFYDNCFKAGILPLVMGDDVVRGLAQEAEGGADFALDLEAKTLATPGGRSLAVDVPSFRREQLLAGADDIALTLRRDDDIRAYQKREGAMRPWAFLRPGQIT